MTKRGDEKAITDVKLSGISTIRDEDFRIVAEDAPVMLWLTNQKGEIIFTNSKWRKFVGAGSGVQVTGSAWLESLHPDDRDHCLHTFTEAFASHQAFEMEYRLKRTDGKYRYVLDTGEPYINHEGKFSGFIGSSADITDRKDHENQLHRSQEELTQHNQEMGLINELNAYLQVCRSLEETYSIVGHYSAKIFSDCAGALYLFNDSHSAVEAVANWGNAESVSATVIAPDDCWALRQSRPHLVEGPSDAIICPHVKQRTQVGYVCVPTIAQGEMIGFLFVQFGREGTGTDPGRSRRSTESRARLVSIAADNLAMALVSLKLREALRTQSVRDPLTSLFNRRYMEETLERELSRCKREGKPLGILMLDIDHFKTYNDTYGHEAGDLVLREVAGIVRSKLRAGDVPCRYGGEELILILPGCPPNIVAARAEQIRTDIEHHAFEFRGTPLPAVTISGGVASFPEAGESATNLVTAADAALYRAKEGGRNRVIVSGQN